ncbi:hypothetical protein ABZS96_36925 [Streptomyces avermitilis]|uniref:hypothetical protein n=1 Tax=Streptomyces avermitilis TaxID=33903 RepID=UPI0033AB122E
MNTVEPGKVWPQPPVLDVDHPGRRDLVREGLGVVHVPLLGRTRAAVLAEVAGRGARTTSEGPVTATAPIRLRSDAR